MNTDNVETKGHGVFVDCKHLAKVLGALSGIVSNDKTRPSLLRVRVHGSTIDATDGHALVRLTLSESHGLPNGLYDAKAGTKLLKVGVTPSPDLRLKQGSEFEYEGTTEIRFPDFAPIIASPAETVAQGSDFGVALIARVLAALDALPNPKSSVPVKVAYGATNLDPMRLEMEFEGGKALALVMPMRA